MNSIKAIGYAIAASAFIVLQDERFADSCVVALAEPADPTTELLGAYLQRVGLGMNGYIYIAPGGRYRACRIGCVRPYGINTGQYRVDGDEIDFMPSRAEDGSPLPKPYRGSIETGISLRWITINGEKSAYVQYGSSNLDNLGQLYRLTHALQGFSPSDYVLELRVFDLAHRAAFALFGERHISVNRYKHWLRHPTRTSFICLTKGDLHLRRKDRPEAEEESLYYSWPSKPTYYWNPTWVQEEWLTR
jgi:hypothetical protein